VTLKLYRGKVPIIAQTMVKSLVDENAIEVEPENQPEVRLDIESVLKEYLRTEREINDEARELMTSRGESFSSFGKIKRTVARKRGFGLGEESIDWIMSQLIEVLLHTSHVEEVWAEDHEMRRLMRDVLRKHMNVEEELDRNVRDKIKNLEQGSNDWDVKHQQEMEKLRRIKGLE
jgi:hypothetical protein